MGEQNINSSIEGTSHINFVKHLLNDIEALQHMHDQNMIEDDIRRIGSEQEFCLVNENWRPSDKAEDILKAIDDPHFTTELAKYNLEINLDPIELTGNCLSQVESQLGSLIQKAKDTAAKHKVKIILTGILPTISKKELEIDFMTPNPRYWALNKMMKTFRGSDFELRLRGVDELSLKHDSVLFEACNTSFQLHLQIPPDDFISSYNWAQAISGPILGICCNSPLLLGRELWRETRIALFQQSIDLRSSSYALTEQQARVTFGDSWAWGSIVDIFKNDIARYKVIIGKEIKQDALEELEKGNIPKLEALCANNSTIYRWNRPCYGVGGGKPHIRIENRYIPSGPTQIDEMANFAFWVGLMMGRPKKYDDLPSIMDFKEAKSNFIKSARSGKETILRWFGQKITVKNLIIQELLPIAKVGLHRCGINEDDINRFLGIIEERTKGNTASQWSIGNYRKLRENYKQDDSLLVLTKSIYENQELNKPVHEWDDLNGGSKPFENAYLVHHIMSRQLFTVKDSDPAFLAVKIMEWKDIHHIPVENEIGEIQGLLTWTHMKRFHDNNTFDEDGLVSDIMAKELHTADPNTEIKEAIKTMKKHEIGCMPVVSDKKLVGIITIPDVIPYDHD